MLMDYFPISLLTLIVHEKEFMKPQRLNGLQQATLNRLFTSFATCTGY
jgi:hypothetical protein